MTGDWRKVRNEGLHDLYCSPYLVLVVKSRRMSERGQWER